MATLEFGVLLRHLRQAAGMSLRALARHIGVSPAYLSQVETGKEPVPAPLRLNQMEQALGLEPGVLTSLTDRVDQRALSELERQPLAVELILALREAGFDDRDYRALIDRVRTGSVADQQAVPLSNARASGLAVPDAATTRLTPYLTPRRCFAQVCAPDRAAVLSMILDALAREDPQLDVAATMRLLEEREAQAPTVIGQGIALPHACIATRTESAVAVASLAAPISFGGSPGDEAVSLVFLVLSPSPQRPGHVALLARIARICREGAVCDALRTAPTSDTLFARLRTFDQKAA